MIEIKLEDWKPIKDLTILNNKLAKLKESNEIGDSIYITEWYATLFTVEKYKFFRRTTVLKHRFIKEVSGKRFFVFKRYEKEWVWIKESSIDQYIAQADFKHEYLICGDDKLMDYMKDLCRKFEYKKGTDWRFIDSYNTNINLGELMKL